MNKGVQDAGPITMPVFAKMHVVAGARLESLLRQYLHKTGAVFKWMVVCGKIDLAAPAAAKGSRQP